MKVLKASSEQRFPRVYVQCCFSRGANLNYLHYFQYVGAIYATDNFIYPSYMQYNIYINLTRFAFEVRQKFEAVLRE